MTNPEENQSIAMQEFVKGIWRENPIFVAVLGMCPALAVTNSAINALAMGLATLFVFRKEIDFCLLWILRVFSCT